MTATGTRPWNSFWRSMLTVILACLPGSISTTLVSAVITTSGFGMSEISESRSSGLARRARSPALAGDLQRDRAIE